MKKFSILFLILVAVLSAVPGVVGTRAASHYQRMIDQIKASGIEVVSHRFHQGWFSSEAETQFALVVPKVEGAAKSASGIQRFSLISRINHGPLTESGAGLAEIDSRLQLDGEPLFPTDYPALIRTFVAFDGAAKTQLDLPPADVASDGKRPQVRFHGVKGELESDAALSRIDLHLSSPGMVLLKEGVEQLNLSDFRVDSHTQQGVGGLMLGNAVIGVERVEAVDSESGKRVKLEGLGFEAKSGADGGDVTMAISYHFDLALFDEKRYGPGSLRIAIEKLPAQVLVNMQQALSDIRRQQLTNMERQVAVMGALMGSGQAVMENHPKLVIDSLRLQTPEGLVEGRFSIQPVGLELTDVNDLMTLLSKLVAEVSLKMPESIYRTLFSHQLELQLKQQLEEGERLPDDSEWQARLAAAVDRQLGRLLQQGVLVRTGDQLVTEASLSDSLLTVNGKMIPLPVATP
ncbi:MAG: YdgA family protein [Candidatus Sedimenticola sp. (ex Thyasira tokunagai)]